VTVEESGLTGDTTWSAIFNGVSESTDGTSLAFTVPAGTYDYQIGSVSGYSVSPSSGTVTVSGAYTLSVTYSSTVAPTYTVTVEESGLTSGTSWTAIFNGVSESGTTSSLTFTVPAGSYSYQIGSVSGYTVSPASGSVTVGGAYVLSVTYSTTSTPAPTTYTVYVNESGLTSGTSWSAVFDGVQKTTTGTSLEFTVASGSYAYQAGSVSGYTVSPASGTATVGGTYVLLVSYTSTASPATPTSSGSVSSSTFNTDLAIALAVAAIAVVLAIVALMRKPKAPTPAPAAAWHEPASDAGSEGPSGGPGN